MHGQCLLVPTYHLIRNPESKKSSDATKEEQSRSTTSSHCSVSRYRANIPFDKALGPRPVERNRRYMIS